MARIARPGGRRKLLCPAAALGLLAAHSANAQAHRATGGGSVVIEDAIGSLAVYTTMRAMSAHSIAEPVLEGPPPSWPDSGHVRQVSFVSEPDPDLGRAIVVSPDMVSVSIHRISDPGQATNFSTLDAKVSIAAAAWQPSHRCCRTVLILAKFN